MFSHKHPPLPKDKKLYNQEELTETSIDELNELRKVPKFKGYQVIIQILLSIVFGIPKIVLTLVFGLISIPIYILCVSIWRTFGKGESGRMMLKKLWAAIARVLLFFLGYHRITFHGSPDPDARFLVANHVCFFDGWLFLPFFPRPLGKKELLNIPGLRDMSEVFEGIPVDRSKSCGLTKELIKNAQDPNRPQIMIMPEGASTSGDYMFRFHLGAFLTDLPVQPAAIRYTLWGVPRSIGHISFFHNYKNHILAFLCIPSISVDIDFLKTTSLKVDGQNDPRKLADETSLLIGNHLGVKVISLSSNAIYKHNLPKKE